MSETTDQRRGQAPDVRNRLAIALDVDDLVEALRIAKDVRPWFGVAKVGLELYAAAGSDAVFELAKLDYRVFLDLKFHDIPTTVRKAARVVGAIGATYLTLHASGGTTMLRAGVEGLAEGASGAGLEAPTTALAVTVLTSEEAAPDQVLTNRIKHAVEAGCGGIVCAATDVRHAKQVAPRLTAVVPGIRAAGTNTHDQARASTPEAAIQAGADLLVVGRAVTGAPDRAAAAAELLGSLDLERRSASSR